MHLLRRSVQLNLLRTPVSSLGPRLIRSLPRPLIPTRGLAKGADKWKPPPVEKKHGEEPTEKEEQGLEWDAKLEREMEMVFNSLKDQHALIEDENREFMQTEYFKHFSKKVDAMLEDVHQAYEDDPSPVTPEKVQKLMKDLSAAHERAMDESAEMFAEKELQEEEDELQELEEDEGEYEDEEGDEEKYEKEEGLETFDKYGENDRREGEEKEDDEDFEWEDEELESVQQKPPDSLKK